MSGIIFAMHAVSFTCRFFSVCLFVVAIVPALSMGWGQLVAVLTGWEWVDTMGGCNACASPPLLPPVAYGLS